MAQTAAAAATSTVASISTHPSSSSSKNQSILGRLWCMLSPTSKHHDKRAAAESAAASLYDPPSCTPTSSPGTKWPTELERVFHYFDENHDGKISPAELQNCMRASGAELSPEDALAAVESSDSDGDGLLGMEDFVRLVEAEGEDEKGRNLRDAFGMYAVEVEGQGCITPKSLRRMLKRLGEPRTVEDCARMIQRFDLNGDGVLSFDEFKIMML